MVISGPQFPDGAVRYTEDVANLRLSQKGDPEQVTSDVPSGAFYEIYSEYICPIGPFEFACSTEK